MGSPYLGNAKSVWLYIEMCVTLPLICSTDLREYVMQIALLLEALDCLLLTLKKTLYVDMFAPYN